VKQEAKHITTGKLGEEIACKFLLSKGYSIIERNFLRKYGELDIIAQKRGILTFIEVKTVSCENLDNVNRETSDKYRPEDNVHPNKIKRLKRVIQVYLSKPGFSRETEWEFGIISVVLSRNSPSAKVKYIKDIIL